MSRDTPHTKNWPMKSGLNFTITWVTISTCFCSAMNRSSKSSHPSCFPLSLPDLTVEHRPYLVRLRKTLSFWKRESIPTFQVEVQRSLWFSNLLNWEKKIGYCRSLQPPSFSSSGKWKSRSLLLTTIQRTTMWESSWTTSLSRCHWLNVTRTIDARGTQFATSWRAGFIQLRSWIRFVSHTWTIQMDRMESNGLSLFLLRFLWSWSLYIWVAVYSARSIRTLMGNQRDDHHHSLTDTSISKLQIPIISTSKASNSNRHHRKEVTDTEDLLLFFYKW